VVEGHRRTRQRRLGGLDEFPVSPLALDRGDPRDPAHGWIRPAYVRAEPPAALRPPITRYWFIAMALFFIVALAGFKPSYVDFFAGKFEIRPGGGQSWNGVRRWMMKFSRRQDASVSPVANFERWRSL
jgi:hypothetical protein